jgi:hypothetical protein
VLRPLAIAQSYTGATTVLVDEFDAKPLIRIFRVLTVVIGENSPDELNTSGRNAK